MLCFGFWPPGRGDLRPLTSDQTCAPFLGRRSLHHWMAREHPSLKCGHNADWKNTDTEPFNSIKLWGKDWQEREKVKISARSFLVSRLKSVTAAFSSQWGDRLRLRAASWLATWRFLQEVICLDVLHEACSGYTEQAGEGEAASSWLPRVVKAEAQPGGLAPRAAFRQRHWGLLPGPPLQFQTHSGLRLGQLWIRHPRLSLRPPAGRPEPPGVDHVARARPRGAEGFRRPCDVHAPAVSYPNSRAGNSPWRDLWVSRNSAWTSFLKQGVKEWTVSRR